MVTASQASIMRPCLKVPFLLDQETTKSVLASQPTLLAVWIATSVDSGPSTRHIAAAGDDNSIWLHSSQVDTLPSPSQLPPAPAQPLPKICTSPPAQSGEITRRPANLRKVSAVPQVARSRATSSASSVFSGASSQRRRAAVFSPPSSAVALATPTTVPITTTETEHHHHRSSTTERQELRDHLRHQAEDEPRSPGAIGLGISGLGRRSLQVHGREEQESGTTSPRSNHSYESQQTIGGRLRAWTRSSAEAERLRTEEEKQELSEKMGEVAVDRQMERDLLEEERERDDRKLVQEAIFAQRQQPPLASHIEDQAHIRRIILGRPEGGTITGLLVVEELDTLVVLRENGYLTPISLSSLQVGTSLALGDDPADDPARPKLIAFWRWHGIQAARIGQHVRLVVTGGPWPSPTPNPNGHTTPVVVVEMLTNSTLEILARLMLPGEGLVAVYHRGDETALLHATTTSLTASPLKAAHPSLPVTRPPSRASNSGTSPHLRAVSVASPSVPARAITPTANSSRTTSSLKKNQSMTNLKFAGDVGQPEEKGLAKFLAARRVEWTRRRQASDPEERTDILLGESKEVERDGYGPWIAWRLEADGFGLGWTVDAIDIISYDGARLRMNGTITPGGEEKILDAAFSSDRSQICIMREASVLVYAKSAGMWTELWRTSRASAVTAHQNRFLLAQDDAVVQTAAGEVAASPIVALNRHPRAASHDWILPYNGNEFFTADQQGSVRKTTLNRLLSATAHDLNSEIGQDRGVAAISMLRLVETDRDLLLAGDHDGELRIWDVASFELQASLALFDGPIEGVAAIQNGQNPALRDCLLVTSSSGAVSVISCDDLEQQYLIPASRAALRRIFVNDHDILLAYSNGKARVWNTQTLEFRRSTGLDAADEMLQDGTWEEILLHSQSLTSPLSILPSGPEPKSSVGTRSQNEAILLDLHDSHEWLEEQKSRPTAETLDLLRALLALCLPFGVDATIDDLCETKLGIARPRSTSCMGHLTSGDTADVNVISADEAWITSSGMTGTRQLVIVSLLRPFLDVSDFEPWAAKLIAFYTASLPDNAIDGTLDFFADYYMDSAKDIQEAARLLFAARVDRTPEQDLEMMVIDHEPNLPVNRSSADRYDEIAAKALTLVGAVAVQKYASIAPSALKAVAESIKLYLGLPPTPRLPLAIELCSRGFTIFQSFVDPMDLLRQLFSLSVIKTPPTIAAQARLAILSVANTNSALFMSTLSMDIMDAKTVEGRTSIMKLCVFMARKRPEVLEHSLPKIAEAVVKSLDPNIGKMRDDVWQAATVILNELVLAFSTIDFNSTTQKLAVGTHEGAVIMYELKTASRLYVIEPHKSPVSLVCFSPDGRRLLTVSLAERDLTVWKVGSSVSGFFNVGGPPRQGGGKGEPFKRIPFMRAEDNPDEERTGLSDIKVDWLADRKVKLMIKETALTFET